MCMCITYRISFVCGLTNPSEKERINDSQCAQYVFNRTSEKPEAGLFKASIAKPETLELCTAATILVRS